jgi:hypothetical protein
LIPDGKHCPKCHKDIGFWPFLVAMSAQSIWCPFCLERLKITENRLRITLLSLVAIVVTGGLACLLSGMPAFLSGLLAGKEDFGEDEAIAHWLAFLCIWLVFLSSILFYIAWHRRRRADLARVPVESSRWKIQVHRLVLRLPHGLRWLAASLLVVSLSSIIVSCLPICRQRTLMWRMEQSGATLHGALPDIVDATAIQRFLGIPQTAWETHPFVRVVLVGPQITDSNFMIIADSMRRLDCETSLYIKNTQISNAALLQISDIGSLCELQFDDIPIIDAGLPGISGLANLRILELKNVDVTDAGLKHLAGLTQLRSLSFDGTQITGSGLSHLSRLNKVRSLTLTNCPLTSAGLAGLAALPGLEVLNIDGTPVTNDGLARLRPLVKLYWLRLSNTEISDAGMKEIGQLADVTRLDLGQTQVTDAGLKFIARMPRLRDLALDKTRVTDAGMKELVNATTLVSLGLEHTSLTDKAVDEFLKMPNLTSIAITGTKLTERGIARLKTARPSLSISNERNGKN